MTALKIRFLNFQQVLAGLQRNKCGASRAVSEQEEMLLQCSMITAFSAIEKFISKDQRCLLFSVSMATYAAHKGLPVDLVFGATIRPFQAHCWIQHQSVVLNDSCERVRVFAPIMVV